MRRNSQPKLDLDLFAGDLIQLVKNRRKKTFKLDSGKHLFIGFVKPDNQQYFLDGNTTKLYYTGKTKSFPSTVALNKLYYFMPYIKGKGVRDLYLVRVARIGNKAEVKPDCGDTDPRIVFELDYLCSLPDYEQVKLNIFNTYRDTLLGSVVKNI